jgi:hypothetical protein
VSEAFAGLRDRVEQLFAAGASASREEARACFAELRGALARGELRAAEPDPGAPTGWRVNTWVKQGILLGFRHGEVVDASMDHGRLSFFDKDTCRSSASTRRPGFAWSRAARPCGTERSSPAASCACRRCTSTSARTSGRAR